jgi:hypothetical protein
MMASEFANKIDGIYFAGDTYYAVNAPDLVDVIDAEMAEVREVLDNMLRNIENNLRPSLQTLDRARALVARLGTGKES